MSFMDLGRSESSAFSSEYHFFHCRASVSNEWQRFLKMSKCCSPWQAAQIWSEIKLFIESGVGVGFGSTLPIKRWSIS